MPKITNERVCNSFMAFETIDCEETHSLSLSFHTKTISESFCTSNNAKHLKFHTDFSWSSILTERKRSFLLSLIREILLQNGGKMRSHSNISERHYVKAQIH